MLPFGMKSAPQPSLPLNSCLPGASYLPQPSFRRRPPAPTQFCRFTRRGGPFVFILLRIPFPATLLFSHPYKTAGMSPSGYFRPRLGTSVSSVSLWQILYSQQLAASFVSLCPLQKSQLLCNQANPASFCKTPGWGYPSTSAPGFTSAVICITCRLYPLRSQSIAHTSRHHGGGCTPNLPNRHSSLATCPVPPLLSQPPFARFLYPAYTSKARRTTPCSACKHFAPKCVRPCAWRCRWSLPRLAG